MKVAFAVVLALGVLAVAAAEGKYSWTAQNAAFDVESVTLDTGASPFQEGTHATVEITGSVHKSIVAGTVKFKVYEDFVQHFTDSGNYAYFECTNKGCNPNAPVALTLEDSDRFSLKFDYVMPRAYRTGEFHMVIWGQDQDHFPYDFSVTLAYGYNSTASATPALRGAAPAALAAPEPENNFSYNATNGAFVVKTVDMTGPSTSWSAGENVNVIVTGVVPSKQILAGTVKYKIYEFGVRYFVAEGNRAYFTCTNKGCNPDEPVALRLSNPTSAPSDFTLTLPVTLPKKYPGGTGVFYIDLWGEDQDHYPHDFDVTVRYALTA